MSAESVEQFFRMVAKDDALQTQLKSLSEDRQDEDLIAAICEMGAAHGLVFAGDDLLQFYQRIVPAVSELDDAALEQVNAAGFFDDLGKLLLKIVTSARRMPWRGYPPGHQPSDPWEG